MNQIRKFTPLISINLHDYQPLQLAPFGSILRKSISSILIVNLYKTDKTSEILEEDTIKSLVYAWSLRLNYVFDCHMNIF